MCLSFAWKSGRRLVSAGTPREFKMYPPDVLVENVTPTLKFVHILREGVRKEKMENLITSVTPLLIV